MRFAFRTWARDGGHLLDRSFVTPQEAGIWRRETFGSDRTVRMTFVAVDRDGDESPAAPNELAAYQSAWLRPDLDEEIELLDGWQNEVVREALETRDHLEDSADLAELDELGYVERLQSILNALDERLEEQE